MRGLGPGGGLKASAASGKSLEETECTSARTSKKASSWRPGGVEPQSRWRIAVEPYLRRLSRHEPLIKAPRNIWPVQIAVPRATNPRRFPEAFVLRRGARARVERGAAAFEIDEDEAALFKSARSRAG
ncbi:hypothetical protein KM043_009245 [Ampulex compressa]|nr:hypothetical protein KM043_009245 [Ampulex compressa]